MIEVKGIRKAFGANAVLRDVDLAIADGEFFCLLGPSGCGKTTLLRVVAGLEKPDAGSVTVGGKDVGEAPAHKRGCALVFQNYALWPHLTVGGNIAYGLEVLGKPKPEIRSVIDASLRAYHLEGLEARYPHQLSGGQQQRVALARAMAVRPQALLMDEPLSNLDASLRKSLRRELLEFHRRSGGTILYVTHDQEEALALSDRLAVMMDGKIAETGRPADLYARPRRLETALFLGDMNVLRDGKIPAALRETGSRENAAAAADATALCIRPENVRVHAADSGANAFLRGTLAFSEFMGTHATLGVDTEAGRILSRARLNEAEGLAKGQSLFLEFPPEHCLWY
jgi:ABC-type Fe3+/spermidine/putrescine transport system ATPase subunit